MEVPNDIESLDIQRFYTQLFLWLKKECIAKNWFSIIIISLIVPLSLLLFFGFSCVCFPMWLEYKMRFSLRINILRCRSLCTHIALRSSSLPYPKLCTHTHTHVACLPVGSYSRSLYGQNKRKVFHTHINQIFHPCIYDSNVLQPVWFNSELKCSWRCRFLPARSLSLCYSAMGNVRLWKGHRG